MKPDTTLPHRRPTQLGGLFVLLLLLASAGMVRAGSLITFIAPATGLAATNGIFDAKVHLIRDADPATLKITLNGTDVTVDFNVASCAAAPCEVTAQLTVANGIAPGWNYLAATVNEASGAAEAASEQFSYTTGLGDPTASGLPYAIQVQQYASNLIIEGPVNANFNDCTSPQFLVADLNRSTLATRQSQCMDASAINPYLQLMSQSDLVFIISPSPSTPIPRIDFSPIGGTNFVTVCPATGCTQTGYSVVGYGKAGAGQAFEAWQEAGDDFTHYKSLNGTLINIGTPQQALYAFTPNNNVGFAIVPGAAGTAGSPGLPTIYVGNVQNIPFGFTSSDPPPNQTRPINAQTLQGLFSSTTYTPSWPASSAAGGMWLLTLNRSDLTLYSSNVYVTNCGDCTDHTTDNAQISALATALSDTNANRLFMLTSIGVPFNAGSDDFPLVFAISALGISPYSLQGIVPDQLGTTAKAGYSMVAYRPFSPADLNRSYSTAANTQQGETGALMGVFAKKKNAQYEAINVSPFNLASFPENPTADDFLSPATSYAIASTSPVAWPYSSTAGQKAAYGWLSNQLITYNLYCAGETPCSCPQDCFDIRSYYNSSSVSAIYLKQQPNAVPYPGDVVASNNGFTQEDFTSVQGQLELESVYLSEVIAYQIHVSLANSAPGQNVAIALSNAGLQIATGLEDQLGTPASTVGPSAVSLTSDSFNTVAGLIAIASPFFSEIPIIGAASGVLWSVSGIISIVNDAQSTPASADPYVTQLGDLISKESGMASQQAIAFNTDMSTQMGTFFNGVFSDWFRLQTVALLSINQQAAGWYSSDGGSANTAYISTLTAKARTTLWLQVLPKFFYEASYVGVASGYLEASRSLSPVGMAELFSFYPYWLGEPGYPLEGGIDPRYFGAYGWDNRTSGGTSVCEDYVYVLLNNKKGNGWNDAFGVNLFGPPTSSDGLGNLNLDRNFVYDESGIPFWPGLSYPQQVNQNTCDPTSPYCDAQGVDFACAAHPLPWNLQVLQPAFSNLSASQSINELTTSISLSGTISAGTKIPTGSVIITIDNMVTSATIGANGSFSAVFPTRGIPAASAPYVISYTYAESKGFYGANDESTALTVLSTVPTIQLSLANNPASYGQTISLNAVLTCPAGTPTGQVTFYRDGSTLVIGRATINNGGASVTTSTLPVGVHAIYAAYSGGGVIQGANSPTMYQTINQATAVFQTLTPSQTIGYYTPNVSLSGVVQGSQGGFPSASEQVLITIGGNKQNATVGANGAFAASFPTLTLAAGSYPIQYSYPGDTNFSPVSNSSTMLTVGKITPVFSGLSPSQTIQAGTPSIRLAGTIAQSAAIPTGSVTITIDGQLTSTPIGSDGAFSTNVNTQAIPGSANPYPITYKYAGDANFYSQGDVSTTLTVAVATQTTTTTMSSSPNPANYGAAVTFTAMVKASSGTPTGTVTFYDSATALGSAALDSTGQALFTIVSLSAGSHAITASYAGAAGFSGSTSLGINQVISPLTATFSNLTSSQSVVYGTATVNLSGTVSAANGPSAAVAETTQASTNENVGVFFSLDPTGVDTGSATFSVWIKTTVQAQQLILQEPDASPGVYIQNNQIGIFWSGAGPDTGWLSTDTTPISDGQWHQIAISFNQGNITIYKDGNPTEDMFTATTSVASSNAVNFGGGAYQHIPSFVGEMWNAKIWASASSQSDIQADMYQTYGASLPASLRLLSSFDASAGTATNLVNGTPARVEDVTMAPDNVPFLGQYPAVNEQVSVTVNGVSTPSVIGKFGAFTANIDTSQLAVGSYPITYQFKGDSVLTSATDATTKLTVTSLASVTTLTSSLNPSTLGQAVTFTATVTSSGGTPAGTVTFYDGTTPLGTGMPAHPVVERNLPLGASSLRLGENNLQATFTTSSLAVGTHSITASYGGSAAFSPSTSAPLIQTVNAASTTTTVTSSLNPSTSGQLVTFTATVTGSGGTPTGTVSFNDGTTVLGTPTLVNGVATFSTSSLAVGTHSITASYGGSTAFLASTSAALAQTVTSSGPVQTILTLVANPNPATNGQTVTFTATVTQNGPVPTGNVTISEPQTVSGMPIIPPIIYGTGNLVNGVLTVVVTSSSMPTLSVGSHAIFATYSGDANYSSATSPEYILVVNP
jgi:Bacterial Ig-like domain (group 3)/Concanavalin A-like lectin/glucanases superfamily